MKRCTRHGRYACSACATRATYYSDSTEDLWEADEQEAS